jgi:hypothetical protein
LLWRSFLMILDNPSRPGIYRISEFQNSEILINLS